MRLQLELTVTAVVKEVWNLRVLNQIKLKLNILIVDSLVKKQEVMKQQLFTGEEVKQTNQV